MPATDIDNRILAVAEHLLRARKRKVLAPLNRNLARALAARFRSQGTAVGKALAPLLRHALREADADAEPRKPSHGILAAAATAMAQRRAIQGFAQTTRRAYDGGGAIAAGELESDAPGGVPGPGRVSADVEADLDGTTLDRLEAALRTAFEEDLAPARALSRVSDVFQARVDAAPSIAEHEVSQAFHQGQTDAARAISTDIGEDVEKRWDCEPTACDECLDCEGEDWVDIDFEYAVFGVDDPPGHPNCNCGLSFRRAPND